MAGATNTKQLRDNLANYDAQLDQVEAALTNDPESQELLKLKTDLTEVKQLTLDLLQLAPEPPKRKERSSISVEWKAGDPCRAIWGDTGKYYNATIDVISADCESCTLTFDGYNSTEIIKLCDLRPLGWEEEEEGRAGVKRKKVDSRANAKEKRAEMREVKKKKAQKKKERLQEIDSFHEKEKSRWQSFAHKYTITKFDITHTHTQLIARGQSSKSKGVLNGKQKRSIFAVPDSLSGRVGVGTCNIGGKGMTDFSTPPTKKNVTAKH